MEEKLGIIIVGLAMIIMGILLNLGLSLISSVVPPNSNIGLGNIGLVFIGAGIFAIALVIYMFVTGSGEHSSSPRV